jgi:hypothetical protein
VRRRDPARNMVTPDVVDQLRASGASESLVAFADRHAVRYSEADLDRTAHRWFLAGVFVTVLAALVIAWLG